jgi:hypothetical protein
VKTPSDPVNRMAKFSSNRNPLELLDNPMVCITTPHKLIEMPVVPFIKTEPRSHQKVGDLRTGDQGWRSDRRELGVNGKGQIYLAVNR